MQAGVSFQKKKRRVCVHKKKGGAGPILQFNYIFNHLYTYIFSQKCIYLSAGKNKTG